MDKEYLNELDDYIDNVAKVLTRFAFRDGPVEDMHAEGKLSQEDMKVLNKFMVNRLAYIFNMILTDTNKFGTFIEKMSIFIDKDWDKALYDDGGYDELISNKSK